ncbi:MAG: metal ABC transporter permease [bacterium]
MEFFNALIEHNFLQHALLAGVLASLACGVMGSYVVVKKIGYLAGGISHAVLGGMGAALFFGYAPMAGALVAAVLVALLIGVIKMRWREEEDTLIGALWAIGMAIGVLFLSRTPGYNTDLMGFLFGNILLVSSDDLWRMLVLNVMLLGLVAIFYRQFLAIALDEEFARLRGVPVTAFYLLFLCLVAVTVVLLIQVVGVVLVIALLTLPAAIAGHYVFTLGRMMLLASALGIVFTSGGLYVSYQLDFPTGAIIILVAGVTYALSTLMRSRRNRVREIRSD